MSGSLFTSQILSVLFRTTYRERHIKATDISVFPLNVSLNKNTMTDETKLVTFSSICNELCVTSKYREKHARLLSPLSR